MASPTGRIGESVKAVKALLLLPEDETGNRRGVDVSKRLSRCVDARNKGVGCIGLVLVVISPSARGNSFSVPFCPDVAAAAEAVVAFDVDADAAGADETVTVLDAAALEVVAGFDDDAVAVAFRFDRLNDLIFDCGRGTSTALPFPLSLLVRFF